MINGFRRINLENIRSIREIILDDKIIHEFNGCQIKALVILKRDQTFEAAYRITRIDGQKVINVNSYFMDEEQGKIKAMIYHEAYRDKQESTGHYNYLDKRLTEIGI